MKRRELFGAAAAVAAGTATLTALGKSKKAPGRSAPAASDLGAPFISQNRREFRMATSWPKDFPGLGVMPNRFADALRAMSGGRLDVKVFAAGELVGGLECFDAVSTGGADMYHAAEYYWQGKAKAFTFFTSVPMGMTVAEMIGWMDYGGGQQLWEDLSKQFNIIAFQAGNTGHQMGGWFKKEMNSLEDFKGLKMRMPGLGGEVIRRLGGAAIALPGGEIYQSLQSGAIDATEWVGPWNDLAFGFHREASYYYAPGFHEAGPALSVGINLDVWETLAATDKAMIRAACRTANDTSIGEYTHENGKALQILKEEHGIQPRFFSDEIMAAIGKTSVDVLRDVGTSDAQTQKVYESFQRALLTYRDWTDMSDGRYIKARQLALGG